MEYIYPSLKTYSPQELSIQMVPDFQWLTFFVAMLWGMRDLSSPTGIKPVPRAVEARTPNHWTAQEVSQRLTYNFSILLWRESDTQAVETILWMLLFLGHQYVVRSAPVLLGSGSEHSPPSARCPEGDQRTLTAALDADNRSVSSRRVRTVLQSPQETGARAARQAAWPPLWPFYCSGHI